METAHYESLFVQEDDHWWFRGRRAVVWALLQEVSLPPDPAILDAGCGTGRNLLEFGTLGHARGIEPSQDAIDFCAQRGIEVQQGYVENLPYETGEFDLVLMLDVLEHIEDDDAALRELHRVTAPGGSLLLTVPAYPFLWSAHDESHHHFRRYTESVLRGRITAAGWTPRVVTHFNSTLLAPIAAVRLVGRRFGAGAGRSDYEMAGGRMNDTLAGIMRGEARLIRRGVRFPAGVSIGLVCERT